jgi:hypothetical protein
MVFGLLEKQENRHFETKIISEKNQTLDIDTLVTEYYPNPQDYFEAPKPLEELIEPYYSEGLHPVRQTEDFYAKYRRDYAL